MSVKKEKVQMSEKSETQMSEVQMPETKSVDQQVVEEERKAIAQQKGSRKVRIRIPSESRGAGSSPVPVGVNGVGYLIKRDEEVEVPEGVWNVLMEAKESIFETYEEYGQKKTRFREANRFPVQFLGYVDQPNGVTTK